MNYDLTVIGAGWAGVNAAINAARLGKKVCLLEENELGGTCLNSGCIPAKTFVQYSKQGLSIEEIQRKKGEIIQRLKQGMVSILKSEGIDYLQEKARIEAKNSISLNNGKKITSKYILIATGSFPKDLPKLRIDHKRVLSSEDVLNLKEVPKRLLVVGGGVLGCEFASIFQRLGAEVTIVEVAEEILPGFDTEVSKKLRQLLQKSGITAHTGKSAEEFNHSDYDKVLIAVGRTPAIEGAWSDAVKITSERGVVCADRELKTKVTNIFAAGDCIGGYMLAHVAAYEGELAAGNMFSKPRKRDYSSIPTSIFTSPEAAFIGISEEEAKKFGADYKAGVVHYLSIGMAHIMADTRGFVKVITEASTGRILGVAIVGLQATELINTFSILMKNKIAIGAVKSTMFAHPSISEIMAEVARSFQ